MLRELPAQHEHRREMIATTLFHDIVYDSRQSDNEEQSLAIFPSVTGKLAADGPLDLPLISAMILATKGHHFGVEETTADAAINILLKAALSILWHPDLQIHQWYARGVRQEYAFVPEAPFREARARILTGLRDDLLGSNQLTAPEMDALRRNTAWELNGS